MDELTKIEELRLLFGVNAQGLFNVIRLLWWVLIPLVVAMSGIIVTALNSSTPGSREWFKKVAIVAFLMTGVVYLLPWLVWPFAQLIEGRVKNFFPLELGFLMLALGWVLTLGFFVGRERFLIVKKQELVKRGFPDREPVFDWDLQVCILAGPPSILLGVIIREYSVAIIPNWEASLLEAYVLPVAITAVAASLFWAFWLVAKKLTRWILKKIWRDNDQA